ncbi:MAG: LPS-assembly protein LptD [Elusimicrobia bacterium]|nr:LPS-assembly protein LptD [Elusimicrobiota bacterium]
MSKSPPLNSLTEQCGGEFRLFKKRPWLFLLFLSLVLLSSRPAQAAVEISTATGQLITFDNATGIAVVEGDAVVNDATATLKADKIRVNTKTRDGEAEGHIRLENASGLLLGERAIYDWETSTGVIYGARGLNEPWRISASEMTQLDPEYFYLKDGSITSCDEDPPHYRIRSRTGLLRRGKRIKLYRARLVPDDTPIFFTPFYTKSLIPKKYRLRIEPGQSSRDGFTAKTVLGYPLTPNTWTNIRWDYLQYTGNGGGLEHRYNTNQMRGVFDSYYIRDSNPDQEVPRSKRYTILWNHYQRITQQLTLNSKIDLKSDQVFGNSYRNVGNQVSVENQTRGLLSEAGFNYQFPVAAIQALFDRKDSFDSSVSSKQFISHLTIPRLIINTAPLKAKFFPIYTSLNGTYTNDTEVRTDPKNQLRYKKNATAGVELKRDFKIRKKLTLTPMAFYNQSWDNRVLSSTYVVTEKDQYVGRYTLGGDIRRRFYKRLDTRIGYRYGIRNRLNQTNQDFEANDYGVESNQLAATLESRIGRSTRLTLSSGYDYREAPRNDPMKYKHSSERITPPSLDISMEVRKNVSLFFRETYSVFDSRTKTPINTPANTSGEIQVGSLNNATYFSQGFSYSKKGFGNPSELFLTNKMKFYLTQKWYVDVFLSFRAVGEKKLNYRKLFPIERGLRVARDMHCWLFRAEFSSRPDRHEASFYIDLKTSVNKDQNVFNQGQPSVYSTRNEGPDYGEIFPAPADATPSKEEPK